MNSRRVILSCVTLFLCVFVGIIGCASATEEPTSTPVPIPTDTPTPEPPKNALIGNWHFTVTEQGQKADIVFQFMTDDAFTVTFIAAGNTIADEGTYEFFEESGTLSLDANSDDALENLQVEISEDGDAMLLDGFAPGERILFKKLSDDEVATVMAGTPLDPASTPIPKPTVTPSVTYEELYGSWRQGDFLFDALYLHLEHNRFMGEDGRFRIVDAADMEDIGTYELKTTTEWTEIIFKTNRDSDFCAGQIGRYRIQLTDKEELHFNRIEDQCVDRAAHITVKPFVRD